MKKTQTTLIGFLSHPSTRIEFAEKLLQREPPAEYLESWKHLLENPSEPYIKHTENTVVIFRLGKEFVALSTFVFKQICEMRSYHTVPHKVGKLLLGLVNIEGQIRMCISLHKLLEINEQMLEKNKSSVIHSRMIVIEKEGNTWVFPSDEIHGIHEITDEEVKNLPVTLSNTTVNYLKGVFDWKGNSVGYLDEELLFASLKRNII